VKSARRGENGFRAGFAIKAGIAYIVAMSKSLSNYRMLSPEVCGLHARVLCRADLVGKKPRPRGRGLCTASVAPTPDSAGMRKPVPMTRVSLTIVAGTIASQMRHPCKRCDGCRWVCEAHPDRPWEGPNACGCGAPGAPCPACNKPDDDSAGVAGGL
jgi:hypothetical protein